MLIRLFEQDQTPIYLQIFNQIKLQVSSGRLQPEEELPSIRALAERLMVNPNTVARAYRELETAGIVTKRRTTGSYISAGAAPMETSARLELLTEKVDAILADARQLQVATSDLVQLIHQREETLAKKETHS
jgi:GntR family transcriptional regulator